MNKFKVACVQLCATRSIEDNIKQALELIKIAVAQSANFIITPEQTSLMELDSGILFKEETTVAQEIALKKFQKTAKKYKIWLQIGSLAIKTSNNKLANRSFLIDSNGRIITSYDKIHMFDVKLPNGEKYQESKNYQSGKKLITAQLPWGKLGFSICYDLRFPNLYRDMAKSGVDFISVPSAFTKQTGQAHWHVLLRARAIENGCFIFAAAQGGHHENGRDTYGHSMIISPWGEVMAEAGKDPGIITADIEPSFVKTVRQQIPSLINDNKYS